MKWILEIRSDARMDFDEAADWYLAKDPEVRDQFVAAVGKALQRLTERPLSYPIVFGSTVRRAIVEKFRYSIFYSVQDQLVIVHAVFHHSRNPIIWRGRID
jgi:plasmid stabilization system protein ParE